VARLGRQRIKVVVDVGDLVAVPDLVAHPQKDVFDLAAHLGHEVEAAAWERRAGERHVEAARADLLRDVLARNSCGRGMLALLEAFAKRVQELSGFAVAHLAKRERERCPSAEVTDVHLRHPARIPGGVEIAQRIAFVGVPVHGRDCS